VLLLDGQTFADGAFQPNGSLPEMAYQDTLQITSATLPTGSPVLVRLAKTTVATVDGVGADMEFTSSFQATAITNGLSTVEPELLASGIVFQGSLSGFNTFVTPYNNVQSQTLSLHVGDTLQIGGYLDIWQGADAHSWISASGNASQTLEIDVLTPGASYSSASGTTYAIADPEPATSSLLALAIPFLGRRRPRS
jgi:hypothetical protein